MPPHESARQIKQERRHIVEISTAFEFEAADTPTTISGGQGRGGLLSVEDFCGVLVLILSLIVIVASG